MIPLAAPLTILLLLTSSAPAQDSPSSSLPPPLGPHHGFPSSSFDGVPSFSKADHVVMTFFFYWYDSSTNAHILDADGSDALTTHPASLDDYSYRSPAWHKRQLEDMIAAGIDVVLPVFWGAPSEREPGASLHWSFAGLPPLVQALDQLAAEGKKPPRVGLFYDTSTLEHNARHQHIDLTAPEGRDWFYSTIRDFFSSIPPRHWALIDGHPVVGLYTAAFARKHDQSCVDDLKRRFPIDFGGKVPYVIREISWNVRADNVYSWGGAVRPNYLGVAEIGPGYDHSAVPGRLPLVVDRERGAFYERAWRKALRLHLPIIFIETWNEHHEGTDIADSREYGRLYIELTRRYVDMLHQGLEPDPEPGPYSRATAVRVELGNPDQSAGLKRVEVDDGPTAPAIAAGSPCRRSSPTREPTRYVYFAIDDSFKTVPTMNAVVTIEYLDTSALTSFLLHYDRDDPDAPFGGAYTEAPDRIQLTGGGAWKTTRLSAPAARFAGLENGGSDFRLAISGPDLFIRRVTVERAKPANP